MRNPRRAVGVSKFHLAGLLGVDRATLTMFELSPRRVGPLRRAAFAFTYQVLALAAAGIALARLAIHKGEPVPTFDLESFVSDEE